MQEARSNSSNRGLGLGGRRWAAGLVCLGACMAQADTIVLTNGNEISGKIVDPNADPLVLEVESGQLSFALTEIQEVEINAKGFKGKTNEAAAATEAAPAAAQTVLDLPPPASDEERVQRYDRLLTSLTRLSLNPEEASQEELDREEEMVKALGKLGPSVAPQIEEVYRLGDVRVSGAMLEALREADPARASALAPEAIEHPHPEARAMAIKILAESGDKERGAVLAKALEDPRPVNRVEALRALGDAKDLNTAPAMAQLVADPDPAVRQAAIAALQSVTGQAFTKPEEWEAWAAANLAAPPSPAPQP